MLFYIDYKAIWTIKKINIIEILAFFYGGWPLKSENFFEVYLTNRPQFSMVYTLINHRNDVIKCSKLRRVVSLQSFEHFMTSFLWSITECRAWKIVVDFFFTKTFIFSFPRSF